MTNRKQELREIAVNDIVIRDEDNSRVDLKNIKELEDSIKLHGIICPFTVAEEGDGKYRVVAGFRRAHAVKNIGMKVAPVVVRKEKTLEDEFVIQLIENVERENFSTYETASALNRLIDDHNMSRDDIAKRTNKSLAWVSNYLGVFDLPEEVQEMCKTERLTVTHVRYLHPLLKKLDETGIVKVAREIEGRDQDGLKAHRTKLEQKLGGSAAKVESPTRAAAQGEVDDGDDEASSAVDSSDEEDTTESPRDLRNRAQMRSRDVIMNAIEELNAQAEGVDDEAARAKLVGRVEALQWVLGDDDVELF